MKPKGKRTIKSKPAVGRAVRQAAGPKRTPRGSVASERVNAYWRGWGIQAGKEDAASHPIAHEPYHKKALNHLWVRRVMPLMKQLSWPKYKAAVEGYMHSYGKSSGLPTGGWLLMPTGKTVAAVVSVMNEEATIAGVLGELNRLPLDQIIVIVNGSKDRTLSVARKASHALIVYDPDPLGHDVGRALGAKLANADIVLFLDGDFIVRAEQLLPFIYAVDQGTDMALNDISPFLPRFSRWDRVTVMKRFLNTSLNRPDLYANSLTAVPHALSRAALQTIGCRELMIPPKAQVRAILAGLRIAAPASVNVISLNKKRSGNQGMDNPVSRMIVGDHVEAVELAMSLKGERIEFPDIVRNRQAAKRRTGRRENVCR